jgi:rhamnosyltransferase
MSGRDFSTPLTVAVMSAFHPDQGVVSNVGVIAPQVARLIIVDDSGSRRDEFWGALPLPPNVTVRINSSNQGIAASINRGISEALAGGAEYVLTVDQDTPVADDLVASLRDGLEEAMAEGPDFVAAAPATVNGNPYGFSHLHSGRRCSIEVLQSGLLLSAQALRRVGTFREELFIDGVEVDFTIRMHQAGVHVLLVEGVNLTQNLGAPTTVRVLGRTIPTNNHPAFRRYYITRNRLTLFKDYARVEPAWTKMAAMRLAKQSVIAIFEPNGGRKMASMLVGATHALRRRLGRR